MIRKALIGLVLIASPARADTDLVHVPGSSVEAAFVDQSAKVVGGMIANECMNQGWSVLDRDEFSVQCAGSSYSLLSRYNRYQDRFTFNLTEVDGATRVRGAGEISTTNGFGATSSSSSNEYNQMMTVLLGDIGGGLPIRHDLRG